MDKGLQKISIVISLIAAVIVGRLFSSSFQSVSANSSVPDFPTCESRIFVSDGDYTHYDSGLHGIPGVGNLEGSDDVYASPSDNYLQCFCPEEGYDGIQSNWWNVDADGLSREQIEGYKSEGWLEENGLGWNLQDATYLVKNRSFSCALPTPTPTSAPTPTPTAKMTPTVTPTPGPVSACYDLEFEPEEGTAPLTVKFTGHADDPTHGGQVQEYRFDFGDASDGQPQVVYQEGNVAYHRYQNPGEFNAELRIRDHANLWKTSGDCKVTVKVVNPPQVLGTSTAEELPATGFPIVIFAGLLPVGYYLYKRFKLI